MEETDRSHCLRQIDKVCSEKLELQHPRKTQEKSRFSAPLLSHTAREWRARENTVSLQGCALLASWLPQHHPTYLLTEGTSLVTTQLPFLKN